MNEVKRYSWHVDAGCMIEEADGAYVESEDYVALEAECERLRVKLMAIASAEPARHGIEWAKAHAEEGNNEVYAKWREAIDEAHALAAENARLRAELEQSRDLIVEMSTHCNATAVLGGFSRG